MSKLYGWDELNNEIHEIKDQEEQRKIDAEGGWLFYELLANGTAVFQSHDRFVALSTWAKDKLEAHAKFADHEEYRKMQEH